MAGLDEQGVFFSDSLLNEDAASQGDTAGFARQKLKNGFKEFLRGFNEEFVFKYRDQLKHNYNQGQYWVDVDLADLSCFEPDSRVDTEYHADTLADKLFRQPNESFPLFDEAARELADELTAPRPDDQAKMQDVQVIVRDNSIPVSIRDLKADRVSRLVAVQGIVISATSVRVKASKLTLQCRGCRSFLNNISVRPGFEGLALPRKCTSDVVGAVGRAKCPFDPYFIIPDKCTCVDYQVLKLQEAPESVPSGEMARHITLYCDRYLCDRVVPGNRVTALGVLCIKQGGPQSRKEMAKTKAMVGTKQSYIRVVGIDVATEGSGRQSSKLYTKAEEELFRQLAARPNIYELIAASIAPSIFGSADIKKSIACLLFGGSRKKLPDGLFRRGDINLLLLGDPGTAKSQLLKFVEQAAPICVYTSGKGSSAAGLTASVNKDPTSRNYVVEGGAMVLADGGVVCIDEFDKMREDDRVAIHEAMEQQTISIAKAGITTTLNSRCSVLAAANSVFGRWDDTKGDANIDFMPTILSRFDMIFIVKDVHSERQDMTLAKHVLNLHMKAGEARERENPDEIDVLTLKKLISFCRSTCSPRISRLGAEKLKNRYVQMRNAAHEFERETGKRITIPITVRQLEAIVRMAESQAKMRLSPEATAADVDEALRLFQVSTLDAALSGQLTGAEGFTSNESQELMSRIERQMKKRFVIGSQVSESAIMEDFAKQKYPENAVRRVLEFMIRRGEVQYRMQRKMLYRVK